MSAEVVAVQSSAHHEFSKDPHDSIMLDEGLGVRGDAHYGVTVQHLSRVAADASQPNLRQVHLMPIEVLEGLESAGYEVGPGELGENITTSGVDLLDLPVGTRLSIGRATVTVTGLRNPCRQINGLKAGLMKELVYTDSEGNVVRLAGVMAVVSRGGDVATGDVIDVQLPPEPHFPLTTV